MRLLTPVTAYDCSRLASLWHASAEASHLRRTSPLCTPHHRSVALIQSAQSSVCFLLCKDVTPHVCRHTVSVWHASADAPFLGRSSPACMAHRTSHLAWLRCCVLLCDIRLLAPATSAAASTACCCLGLTGLSATSVQDCPVTHDVVCLLPAVCACCHFSDLLMLALELRGQLTLCFTDPGLSKAASSNASC